jgi:hypothetical protein
LSDESFKFTPGKTPKFPMLVMRAFSDADNHVEWILTPAEGAGWYDYKFEAKQEGGVLFVNFDRTMMMPRNPDVP